MNINIYHRALSTKFLYFFIAFLLIFKSDTFSQKPVDVLSHYEDTLKKLGFNILHGQNDSEKYDANNKFIKTLERALNAEKSFDYPFDSLVTIAHIYAPDKSFRIFNWNLPKSDGTYEYYGFIHSYNKKLKSYNLFTLIDKSREIVDPESKSLGIDSWYGAHYYQIIMIKYKRKKYYTLLGWDGNDRLTTKKIIDILYFTKSEKPMFGYDIFVMGEEIKKRVIFEYTSQAGMSLKYSANKKIIIYDHLSPLNEGLTGQRQFYGPDGSYDTLQFIKGKWILVEDIDARNKSQSIKELLKLYNEPK